MLNNNLSLSANSDHLPEASNASQPLQWIQHPDSGLEKNKEEFLEKRQENGPAKEKDSEQENS